MWMCFALLFAVLSLFFFFFFFFFFNDTATTEIYTLSLHDALPISPPCRFCTMAVPGAMRYWISITELIGIQYLIDRKSTRLNSSHANISYAVFCLKKKKKKIIKK